MSSRIILRQSAADTADKVSGKVRGESCSAETYCLRGVRAKSGLMLGLGETEEEVIEALNDIHATGCRIVTIGQYLAPSLSHIPVVEYITPEKFEEYRNKGT